MKNRWFTKVLYSVVLLLCLTPWVEAPAALVMGMVLALSCGNPFLNISRKWTHWLLQISVVGLGFGLNINTAMAAGKTGFLATIGSISFTLIFGYFLGRWLRLEKRTAFLIASGTAICGGSAIAAVAPVIRAKEHEISIALAVVFFLNSIALLIFPYIGSGLHLSQHQFGLWAAIAIHDTSSVVGSASKYGLEALQTATTVKLARALWIIPVSLLAARFFRTGEKKIKIPYFIFFFVLAMAINALFPAGEPVYHAVAAWARQGLVVTLFFIGSGLTRTTFRQVGGRPLVAGILLWMAISVGSVGLLLWF